MWEQASYRETVQGYGKRDSLVALFIFCIQMALLYGQGWLYTTDLPLPLMASLNIIVGLLGLGVALGIVRLSGKRRLGLHRRDLGKSLVWGIMSAAVLIGGLSLVQAAVYDYSPRLQGVTFLSMVIFTVGVFNEEILFRGIIQSRLRGLFPWGWLCSVLTAGLFLLAHYPVHWGVRGTIDFSSVTGLHVCFILLLHFACSGVYRRTDCLWGAIALHFLYNLGTGMLVFA